MRTTILLTVLLLIALPPGPASATTSPPPSHVVASGPGGSPSLALAAGRTAPRTGPAPSDAGQETGSGQQVAGEGDGTATSARAADTAAGAAPAPAAGKNATDLTVPFGSTDPVPLEAVPAKLGENAYALCPESTAQLIVQCPEAGLGVVVVPADMAPGTTVQIPILYVDPDRTDADGNPLTLQITYTLTMDLPPVPEVASFTYPLPFTQGVAGLIAWSDFPAPTCPGCPADGGAWKVTGVEPAGRAAFAADGLLIQPSADRAGKVTIGYTLSDPWHTSKEATITITVVEATPVQPPVPGPDTLRTTKGKAVTGNVLANDVDPAGLPLRLEAVMPPVNGTVTFTADGSVTYTPAAGFTGLDQFSYVVVNDAGAQATGAVAVLVTAGTSDGGEPTPTPSREAEPGGGTSGGGSGGGSSDTAGGSGGQGGSSSDGGSSSGGGASSGRGSSSGSGASSGGVSTPGAVTSRGGTGSSSTGATTSSTGTSLGRSPGVVTGGTGSTGSNVWRPNLTVLAGGSGSSTTTGQSTSVGTVLPGQPTGLLTGLHRATTGALGAVDTGLRSTLPGSDGEDMPTTGPEQDPGPATAWAGALVLAGIGLVAWSTRRRVRRS